ncbi:unnamed protein product [Adineta steineri]|uniref:Uncharacterized protein n=2 Tax=Adineta steineri TaxID=433720 RepID=A0A819BMR9_9BILA|nr:unnamed protein product [Adineta steineri]
MSFSFEINLRFLLDISHQLQENIEFINSYQQEQLVSLEEAWQSPENLLGTELQLYITAAKLNSQQRCPSRFAFVLDEVNTERFGKMQQLIHTLSRDDEDFPYDDDELQNYQDFFKNIKLLNCIFNFNAEQASLTGDCSFNVIVHLDNLNEQRLLLLQPVKKRNDWNIFNAAMVFNMQPDEAQYAIKPITTVSCSFKQHIKNNASDRPTGSAAQYFRTIAERIDDGSSTAIGLSHYRYRASVDVGLDADINVDTVFDAGSGDGGRGC